MTTMQTNNAVEALLALGSSDDASGTTDALVVPEPYVKRLLQEHGVHVPAGVVVTLPTELSGAAQDLTAPLVLKAFGPGLVHKSEVGAVRLGLDPDSIGAAAAAMADGLAAAGITPSGYLIEEQHAGGTELIVGVVKDPSFGFVLLLGLGGIATEILDLAEIRTLPLSREDADDLMTTFPGAALLTGARGRPPVDRVALADLLMAIGGPDGLVASLGSHLLEFECNPIVVTPEGVSALDARLILSRTPSASNVEREATDFSPLFRPRSIAVAGASTKGTGFGNRFLAAYKDAGWDDGLVAIHPAADAIDGVPARASVVPPEGELDYLLVAVPAKAVVDLVREAAGRVRFIHVISGGFREMGEDGRSLEAEMLASVDGTTTRIVGPNCIGVYSPAGRQAFTLGAPREQGQVAVVSQSGGLSGDLVTVGTRRGLRYSKLVSIGNSLDVTAPELLDWLVDDPETQVIGLYLEGATDGARLVEALRRARGRKPVVILSGGMSAQGARAVSSHTGSMAAPVRVWSAVQKATDFTPVESLDDMIATLGYLQDNQSRPAAGEGTLAIGLGGGASVLATDACDRAGLEVRHLEAPVQQRLREMGHGAGTSVSNPVEIPIGPASRVDLLGETLSAILDQQAFCDVLIHVNVAAYYSYGTRGVAPLVESLKEVLSRNLDVRLAVVARNLDVANPSDLERLQEFRIESGVSLFRTFDEAAIAISAAQRFDRAQRSRRL